MFFESKLTWSLPDTRPWSADVFRHEASNPLVAVRWHAKPRMNFFHAWALRRRITLAFIYTYACSCSCVVGCLCCFTRFVRLFSYVFDVSILKHSYDVLFVCTGLRFVQCRNTHTNTHTHTHTSEIRFVRLGLCVLCKVWAEEGPA